MAAGNLQVLFDLSIILDVLQERKDFCQQPAAKAAGL